LGRYADRQRGDRAVPAPDRTNTIALFGESGRLRTAVGDALARSAAVRPIPAAGSPDVGRCALVVAVSEASDLPGRSVLREACANAGTGWLTVGVEFDRAFVGPVSRAGIAGCDTCARRRRRAAHERAPHHETVRSHVPDLDRTRSPLLNGLALDVVAALAGAEATDAGRPHSFVAVDLASLAVSRHRFLPDPGCPDCGGLPDDGPEAARIALGSRPKPDPGTFRVRDLAAFGADLMATYVDPAAGVIRDVRTEDSGSFVRAVAPLSATEPRHAQRGWGRTLNPGTARWTAVLEALERFGGVTPRGRRTTVHGSHRDLADRAIDPRDLGLYPDSWYDEPGFRYTRFSEDLQLRWVWGYSFGRGEPVLVPESHAYYSLPDHDGVRLAYEISNGCALGGALEEAILYGLLEVAERDAFLMTWYGRMPVPELDLDSARDRAVPLLADSLGRRTGYRVRVFATTMEQGIPCLWAMGTDLRGDPGRPKAMCVGGSALDAEQGVVNVLHELAHGLDHAGSLTAGWQEHAAAMVADPSLVRAMGDHDMVYHHPDAFDRFDFLLGRPASRRFDDLADAWRRPAFTDLRDDLLEVVGRYLQRGLDVIVVDQTAPEHRAAGLSCVKVIVPGTLPMTFGHGNRRIHGIPRLYTVPAELGHRAGVLAPADINPHPHPFP
jgi:ribosomal protein S12 methylthiotransferase accessory factor